MELRQVGVEPSSRHQGWTRLWGDVAYDGSREGERYWIDVPNERSQNLSLSGDCWLAWLTPLAITLGEPLRLGVACDSELVACTVLKPPQCTFILGAATVYSTSGEIARWKARRSLASSM